MGLAHFSIGTATNRLDLTRNLKAIDWEPSQTPLEPTWASSALAEGRQPTSHRFTNAIESMTLHIVASSQDKVIEWSQELRRMLIKATEYWDTDYQPDIVYVAARASCETNMRYCWVYGGEVPKDSDPYGQPFTGRGAPSFWERQLVFERGAWMANAPGTGTSIVVMGSQDWCFPHHLTFDGVNDYVDAQSDAKLDNLPQGASMTIEAWIRPISWGAAGGSIAGKLNVGLNSGWGFGINAAIGLQAGVSCLNVGAISASGLDDFTVDQDWHYVLMCYDDLGAVTPVAKRIYLNIDGTWIAAASYVLQTIGVGAYDIDTNDNVIIGNTFAAGAEWWEGDIGWVRISDFIRYDPTGEVSFTPPVRCLIPDIDVNVMGQWIKEGTGTGVGAVANQAGGTAADMVGAPTWDCDCDRTFGGA